MSGIDYAREAERLARVLAEVIRVCGEIGPAKSRAEDALAEYRLELRRDQARRAARDQTSLFDSQPASNPPPSRPYVRQDTSIEAAHDLGHRRAETLRAQVLTALRQRPSTDEQLAERLKIPGNTLRPRRIELVESGLVCDSGERALTGARRKAIVWVAVEAGCARAQGAQ